MTDEVRQRLEKATQLLAQVGGLDPSTQGELLAHHAYYAMFHAACAVILARAGTVPVRHATVVIEFGRLTRDLGDDARRHGRPLSIARTTSVWWRITPSTPGFCRAPPRIASRPRRPLSASAGTCWHQAD